MEFEAKLFAVFQYLCYKGDKKFFREKVPQSESQCGLDYGIDRIKWLTTNKSWIQGGEVTEPCLLLGSCMVMFRQVIPVTLAFECHFFPVLSNFIKACKKNGGRVVPSPLLCNIIVLPVLVTYSTFAAETFALK